jgi:hypothetical protein
MDGGKRTGKRITRDGKWKRDGRRELGGQDKRKRIGRYGKREIGKGRKG